MKRIYTCRRILLLFLILTYGFSYSQVEKVKDYELKHWMTPQEEALKHLIGQGFQKSAPPPGNIRNIAEFEQMQGVLIRYPFGINYTLIAALSERTTVTTIVESQNQQNNVTNQYQQNGVNLANCDFLIAGSDSYWTRDYGPWYIAYDDSEIGIVDFIYNRPRPLDDVVPQKMADKLGIQWFAMDLIHTGGNYMTDGWGVSASTDLVIDENPTMTEAEIDQMVQNYLGVNTYYKLPDPNNTYIDHIDCWGKFLDVDKVLIREVPPTHPQYDEIEATAAFFAAQTSSYGVPYQVYRVYTPNNQPYTNSLIVNKTVYVPIMNSQWDDEALTAYEEAMPGYEVIGFNGSWESTDALHCRVKGTADLNMLYVKHMPLLGDQPNQADYDIEAEITAYSGQSIINDSVLVYYSYDNGPFTHMTMAHQGGKVYTATIPGSTAGTEIAYYIYAVDQSGKRATHPLIGSPDPHRFYCGEQQFPDIAVSISEINTSATAGTSSVETFTISNQGETDLDYDLTWTTAIYEQHQYNAQQSPAQSAWDFNTYTEMNWTDLNVNDEATIAGWTIEYTWNTDDWPQEGSFYVESPSGTQALIASGGPDGTYTVTLDDFNGEEMQGTWKLWIEDTYGDGGHQATNINITISEQVNIPDWLTVYPASGTIAPGADADIDATCNSAGLDPGDYEGMIILASNDPDQPEIEIPVYFTVEIASGLTTGVYEDVSLEVFPNPFSAGTTIRISLNREQQVNVSIYNLQGQIIAEPVDERLSEGEHLIDLNTATISRNDFKPGLYLLRISTPSFTKALRLIRE